MTTTRKTEFDQELQKILKSEKDRLMQVKKTLNLICEKLFFDLVATVEAAYNGEGDSGDIDELIFKSVDGKVMKYAIDTKVREELIDALFYFMPGGWEINEGSYGVLHLDVRNKSLKIAHEERVMETHHREYQHDL